MIRKIIFFFLLFKVITLVFAYLATFLVPLNLQFTAATDFGLRLPYFVWIWGNFDGTHYMEIARNGYHPNEHAFFPFFPLLMISLFNLLGTITYVPYLIVGQLVSNVSFFLALIVITRLLLIDGQKGLLRLFLLAMTLFPTAFFFGTVYNDSLFLLFASLTIYFARGKSWILASVSGLLATLTRLNGLALVMIVVIEYIFAREENLKAQWNPRNILAKARKALSIKRVMKEKLYTVLLIPFAFIGYLAYVHVQFGNWYLVFASMKVWGQDKIIFPLQTTWRYFKIIVLDPSLTITYGIAILELVFVIFYVLLMVYAYKKIRLSYWLFFVVSMLIPSLTGTFAGMPRYGLHLYPLFLVLAMLLSQRGMLFKIAYFAISLILLFFSLSLFTRGYFVA